MALEIKILDYGDIELESSFLVLGRDCGRTRRVLTLGFLITGGAYRGLLRRKSAAAPFSDHAASLGQRGFRPDIDGGARVGNDEHHGDLRTRCGACRSAPRTAAPTIASPMTATRSTE